MLISNHIYYYLILLHFIADFICQSNMSITARGKDFWWLLVHIVAYTLTLFSGMMLGVLFMGFSAGMTFKFVSLLAVIHFFADYILGKISSHLWETKRHRWAFVIMGAEQFIHIILLICIFQLIN